MTITESATARLMVDVKRMKNHEKLCPNYSDFKESHSTGGRSVILLVHTAARSHYGLVGG